jgi:NAD(P)-dependent dehydrogenase (short-subunit alcohol dehydrogenase family)
MPLSLDKAVLVTGGSRGIGKGIAKAFAAAGCRVMITSRKADVLAAATREIGGAVDFVAGNAGVPDDIAACVAVTMERFGAVDVLVNNAFTSPYQGPLVDVDLARLAKTLDVNLIGPLVWIQECWTAHMARAGGTVINVSSGAAESYGTAAGPYGLSKAGLNYLTRHLAVELAPGVRVNAIAPGLVPTDSSRTISDRPLDGGARRVPPLGRLGRPDDVASLAVFLANDAASWLTGQVIYVDGGGRLYDYSRGPDMPKPRLSRERVR